MGVEYREELWPTPRRGGSGADLLDVEEGNGPDTNGPVIDDADTSDGPVTELGGGEPPDFIDSDGDHRPDRNWPLLVVGAACIVLGVRAVYVGVRVLTTELDHPALNWFASRRELT